METTQRPSPEVRRRRAIIGSVLASLAFWGAIRLSDTYTHEEVIDLDYVLPVGSTFAQEPPAAVEASVTASGWDLLRESLRRGNRRITIDSVDIRRNPNGVIELSRELAQAFSGEDLRVEATANPRIVVRTEAIATKALPLRLRESISYAVGFSAAGRPRLDVDSVYVTGPRSRVTELEEWYTDSLVLRNLQDSARVRVTIARDAESAFEVEPRSTKVTVGVQEYTERSLLIPVRVVGYDGPDSVQIFPSEVRVTSAVGLADYERLSPSGYSLVVTFASDIVSSVRELPVTIERAPEFAVTTAVEPRTVEAFLVKRARPPLGDE